MEDIQDLISLLQGIIPIGVAARCVFCLCSIMADADGAPVYKKRLRNALIFLISAEVIAGLLQVIMSYY